MEFLGQATKAIFLDVGGTLIELGEPESAYADILDQYGYPCYKRADWYLDQTGSRGDWSRGFQRIWFRV